MKRLILSIILAILVAGVPRAQEMTAEAPQRTADADHYRRSSLCLILLAHTDKQYAEAMSRVFSSFPMPARYNNHNIEEVRVVRVRGRQSRRDIENMLNNKQVARRLVERWFNRDPRTGRMNLDLVHRRGGFGAFYDDYLRAGRTVRGTALLREEGIELLENTYVLVCDMDYYDRSKGFRWGAFALNLASGVMAGVSAAMDYQAAEAYANGNYDEASRRENQSAAWNIGAAGAAAAGAVVGDLGGFSVKIKAYLYHLKWDESATANVYDWYWVDENTPSDEAVRRRNLWNTSYFNLEYVGDYKAKSGKTILRSWSNEDEVILDVCQRTVEKSIHSLCKKFPMFRPRTPFIAGSGVIYSHIGTKEDVRPGDRYEVVRRERDGRGRLKYKKIGEVEALNVWNNRNISFDNYFDPAEQGSCFVVTKGRFEEFATEPGLQIREKR